MYDVVKTRRFEDGEMAEVMLCPARLGLRAETHLYIYIYTERWPKSCCVHPAWV